MEYGDDDGWAPLDPSPWWMPVYASNLGLVFGLAPVIAFQLGSIFDLPPVWWILSVIGTAVASMALSVLLSRLYYPRAYLNPTTSTLRSGRKRAGYADITEARLVPSTSTKRRSLQLVLRTPHNVRITVLVRDARQNTLEPEVAALVQDMLLQSNIEMPASPDDPKGRFARFNFPTNVTKDEAVQLVAHPPAPTDPLPIPYL
jgi:hypothetical protein